MHARFPGAKHPNPRTIAEVGTLSIEQARAIARQWHELIRNGIDPAAEAKRQAEAERSAREAAQLQKEGLFAVVAEDYLKRKVARQRQARAVERIIRNVLLPVWATGRSLTSAAVT